MNERGSTARESASSRRPALARAEPIAPGCRPSGSDLVARLLDGNRRALARAISLVEDASPEARALLTALHPHTGRARVVGVTGASGAGKSTLVNALALACRASGNTVGILAIDPTSPFSGGALLGDRIRMRDLAGEPGIFIRSMATRGSLGGLAHAAADAIAVLDAAGFDLILVETVGVGQAEVDIARTAQTTIVVEAPGMGDEVQAIKAGVLEIADILVVNKADRPDADRTVSALRLMQGLRESPASAGHHRPAGGAGQPGAAEGRQPDGSWLPPILKAIAARREGIAALRDWIAQHGAYLHESGQHARRERARAEAEILRIMRDRLAARALDRLPEGRFSEVVEAVARRRVDPHTAVDQMLAV